MKKLLLLAALAAMASCQLLDINVGNGVSVNTEINAGEFDSISSQCSLDIIYTQKEGEPRLTLTCDENLVEYYTIEVEDGTLVIDVKWGTSVRPKVKSYLTINSQSLTAFQSQVRANARLQVRWLATVTSVSKCPEAAVSMPKVWSIARTSLHLFQVRVR